MSALTGSYFFLALAVGATALGQFSYKCFSLNGRRVHLVITILFFMAIPYFSYRALMNIPIDVVYVMTAMTVVIVVFLSVWILKERLTHRQIAGVFAIVLGVVVYAL